MSKEAEDIRDAHRAYADAVGTPREREMYRRLREVVERVRQAKP